MIELKEELEKMKEEIENKLVRVNQIEQAISEEEKNIKIVVDNIDKKLSGMIDKDLFLKFFHKPYVIIPQSQSRILVAVPKFIKNFQVGWIWKETEGFYIYQLDQYSAFLGDVPKELMEEINFKRELEGTVQNNIVHFEPSQRENIKKKLGHHLKDIGDNTAVIIRGHEFDVIAEMVENGCLPFKPKPVDKEDLREQKSDIKLRPYQKDAEKKFMETGAIGVFHPTGAGKSFISLYLLDVIKGKKLVVVPTRTLLEQWNYYIETFIPHAKDEIKLITYQGYRASEDEYVLTVFDECQKLPADTFSRLAVIKTKYRIGLSASPHREDKRESYIFALTGFPVGLNWREYMETTKRAYHPVYVHIVRSETVKLKKMDELIDWEEKTLIFCDSIELGKKASDYYKGYEITPPFVHGNTSNRLKIIEDNRVVVVSRVADLGISIKNLKHIIEIDFLFGSRQQELQRTGRLMHSEEKDTRHDIIMTQKEFDKYGKRLWALQEKGFTIKMHESE